jgi:hypothetical protein
MNDADGSTRPGGADETDVGSWDWLWLSLLAGLIIAAGIMVLRDRRRFSSH